MKNKQILLLALFLVFTAFKADKPAITIFMIGDSTMADKDLTGGSRAGFIISPKPGAYRSATRRE